MDSPSAASVNKLIFGSHTSDPEDFERAIEQLELDRRKEGKKVNHDWKHPSFYVEAFERMVMTVHEHESHLLTEDEWGIFKKFSKLDYNARYCIVRLILRKPGKWHSLESMEKFKQEVGEDELALAMVNICRPLKILIKEEEDDRDIIDLTFEDEEEVKNDLYPNPIPGPPHIDAKPNLDNILKASTLGPTELNLTYFCEDETSMSLNEILWTLGVEQLRSLVKETKIKPRKFIKPDMISALLYHASTQTVLDFVPSNKSKKCKNAGDNGLRQTQLLSYYRSKKSTQEKRLLEMALGKLGRCFRVNPDFYTLIVRLNIAYDRASDYPESLLLVAILTLFRKRVYPDYTYTRDATIWPTREQFLKYVEALELHAAIDHELAANGSKARSVSMASNSRNTFTTPMLDRNTSPLKPRIPTAQLEDTMADVKNEHGVMNNTNADPEVEEPVKVQKARRVKRIFGELIFPKWKDLVAIKQEPRERAPGLERFEPGHVFTRIFSKVTHALASIQEYEAEAEILDVLLAQRLWRRGKRGKWYDRRALLDTNYLCFKDDRSIDERILFRAINGIREALKDEDTGTVFRPKLIRRLRKLEKKLKIPVYERCNYEGDLREAEQISFKAVRIWDTPKSLNLDGIGRVKGKENSTSSANNAEILSYLNHASSSDPTPDSHIPPIEKEGKSKSRVPSDNWRWKGKSIWKGKDNQPVNVETCALEFYQDLGFKGFHSESSVLTTIFALVFWDIIFADVPGAFGTPYQTAPLDIAEDSFYCARKDLIEYRLMEVKAGMAPDILERHDDEYRAKQTLCVGVRWDICEKQDLIEIVKCLGGNSLSIICRLFCEDYIGRSSGVPDLIVWNAEKTVCKFVEVKGPGDTPQENQKLWLDTLLGAGASVEICKVIDINQPEKPRKRVKIEANSKAETDPRGSDAQPECEEETPQPDHGLEGPSTSIIGKKRSRPPDDDELLVSPAIDQQILPRIPPPGPNGYVGDSRPTKRWKATTPQDYASV